MMDFYICAEELYFDEINKSIGIQASEIRKKSSFAIKDFAKDYWSLNTGYEISDDICIQIQKIQNKIIGRENTINEILRKFNAECGFVITIKLNDDVFPAIYFERDFVELASNIKANINVDFT